MQVENSVALTVAGKSPHFQIGFGLFSVLRLTVSVSRKLVLSLSIQVLHTLHRSPHFFHWGVASRILGRLVFPVASEARNHESVFDPL
jgi:hypothetical protein